MVVLIHAHPFSVRSVANRGLLTAVADLPGLSVRRLYDLYPDFSIDVAAEQEAIAGASAIVIQHPIYWYSVPALLKLWMEEVLAQGWAYADGGDRLQGKRFLCAATTGGGPVDYQPGGSHDRALEHYLWPILQTARFCGMHWEEPFIVSDAHRASAALENHAAAYRARLEDLIGRTD